MGNLVSDIFEKVYIMMKLSLMFWAMTFMGGVVLGVGPALMAVMEMFVEYEWDHAGMKWSGLGYRFKDNFKLGNAVFYSNLVLTAIIGYNLYLAIQVKGILFMFIQFLLIVALILNALMYLYATVIHAHFDIAYKNLMKLSFISVFANMSKVLRILLTTALIGFITYKYKGLILFITVGLFVIMSIKATQSWMLVIEDQIEG